VTLDRDKGFEATPGMRAGNLAIGLLFVGVAVAIVRLADPASPVGSLLAALVIGGLGVDALFSAARGRRSLLSRLGPLP